jgi:hypothetical protein
MTTIEPQHVKESQSNEIDLLDILSRIWYGLGKAFRVISIFLIKNSLWLIGFIILGAGVAFLFYSISQRHYTSTMVGQMNVLSNTYVIDYINQLGKSKDSLVYAKVLNIPASATKHISSMNAFFGIDTDGDNNVDYVDITKAFQFSSQDSMKRKVPKIFYVQVTVSEPTIFPLINMGITTTLKNNPHFIERNKLRIAQLKETIAELEGQYRRLDSLEKFEYFERDRLTHRATGQLMVLNEKERQLYHEHLLNLREKLLSYKRELLLYSEPITIIQDFPALSIIDNPLGSYIKTWILVFLCGGIFFLIIRYHRKRILQLIREKHY